VVAGLVSGKEPFPKYRGKSNHDIMLAMKTETRKQMFGTMGGLLIIAISVLLPLQGQSEGYGLSSG